jgi:hypothetical protein
VEEFRAFLQRRLNKKKAKQELRGSAGHHELPNSCQPCARRDSGHFLLVPILPSIEI